jgi:hypothetical protein
MVLTVVTPCTCDGNRIRTIRTVGGNLSQFHSKRKTHEVAELMGDPPETVRMHYARMRMRSIRRREALDGLGALAFGQSLKLE